MTNFGATPRPMALSVLDLAPVPQGSTSAEALANSLVLVRRVEELGYARHWVAEHHNMLGIASSAPAVLIAHLAAATTTIRVGSGGVMLPNHPPLVVAEQFGMLEALHPGRIDLGLGRAPGTDPATAHALRRSAAPLSADDFPQQLGELMAWFNNSFPEDHPYRAIHAVPAEGNMPAIWLLGSSGYSAQVAGLLGLPFAFAHHFSPENTEVAMELYHQRFTPSEALAEPYPMLGVAAVVAPSDEEAVGLHGPSRLQMLLRRTNRPSRMVSPDEAAAHQWGPGEEALAANLTRHHLVGSPATVMEGLEKLAAATGAREMMITTNLYDFGNRVASYELLAGVAGLAAPSADTRTQVGAR
ncbi:MAG TPA: LLM class flavin-dependent oxidoreductase [Acidimicrobiales bacterium]|nr:LLM class flavin-dependent oxidoreductase [Acidimicrobiales bacterium]